MKVINLILPAFAFLDGNSPKEKKEVYDELLNCGENEIVITYRGWFYDKIEKVSMSFMHDTHYYIIGLQLNEKQIFIN